MRLSPAAGPGAWGRGGRGAAGSPAGGFLGAKVSASHWSEVPAPSVELGTQPVGLSGRASACIYFSTPSTWAITQPRGSCEGVGSAGVR